MSQRDQVEDWLHFLLISVLVNALEEEGFAVEADHVGGMRQKPESIGGYVPDIVARRGDHIRLIEVETQSTLASPRTASQIEAFCRHASATIIVAVPFDCLALAHRLREELDLDFVIMPCYPLVKYVGVPR